MIDAAYAFFERRILEWETARRGRRLAGGVEADADAIGALGEVLDHVSDASVVSFDLFDTLLMRRGLSPEAIDRKVAGFARAVAGAEAGNAVFAAKQVIGPRLKSAMSAADEGDEPLLRDIYAAALAGSGASEPEVLAADLIAYEVAIERRGIRAAPGADALLTALRAPGRKIVAVSDMYFAGAEVEAILESAGLRRHFDEVFVSSDLRWTKRGGRIFELVAGRLGVAPGDILHVGDRMDSDVTPARAAGWRTLHYVEPPEIAATEAARIAESHIPSPALRRARVEAALGLGEAPYRTPEGVAEGLFGPACGLLAMTALTHARSIGARRLYHLTRDATVIGGVAAAARAAHPWLGSADVEIRELAISRALGARLQVRGAQGLWKLAHLTPYLDGGGFTAAALRRTFDLPEDAFTDETRGAAGPALEALLREERHAAPMARALDEARAPVEAYLRDQGVFDAAPSVAVDIGYSGTFAVQLSDAFALEAPAARRMDFLFLFTSRFFKGNLRRLHPQIGMRAGVALDHRRRAARYAGWNFAWAEPFLVDPDRGRLLGYEGGAPQFEESPLSDQARERHRAIRAAILRGGLDFIDRSLAAPGDAGEMAAIIQRRVARFAARPTRAEVAAIRELTHQTGQTALASRDSTRRVRWPLVWRDMLAMKDNDYWVQGGLRRSGLGVVNRLMADAPERDRREDPRGPWD